ncbi:hypothetical protein HDU97_009270, partial [Phlyctochytrium planicorne]
MDDHRRKTKLFLVQWKDYGVSERTWEPYANVKDVEALDEFKRLKGLKEEDL